MRCKINKNSQSNHVLADPDNFARHYTYGVYLLMPTADDQSHTDPIDRWCYVGQSGDLEARIIRGHIGRNRNNNSNPVDVDGIILMDKLTRCGAEFLEYIVIRMRGMYCM